MAAVNAATPTFSFDDSQIAWQPFAGLQHLELALLEVDEAREIVDLIVRFEPNEKVAIHNHIAQTNMFIIQGELRMYETDGSVREVRPAGRYYRGKRDDCHSEGGGPEGAIVFYSVRGHGATELFDIMDDNNNVEATIGMADVVQMWNAR
jgi:2,4'-dihydroxyacetophenone dioxygenase